MLIFFFCPLHCPFSFCGRCKNLIPLLLNSLLPNFFPPYIFSSREKSQLWLIISGVTASIPQVWWHSRTFQLGTGFLFGKVRCVLCVDINMHYWMQFWKYWMASVCQRWWDQACMPEIIILISSCDVCRWQENYKPCFGKLCGASEENCQLKIAVKHQRR